MNRRRRSVAAVAALTVLGEAIVLGVLHWILGLAVRAQEMSLAGLSTTSMSLTTWIAGALLGGFLLLCGLLLLRATVRDRLGGRAVRAALVGCLALHGGLATLSIGLVGWPAFAGAMLVFGLVLLTLMSYPANGAWADGAAKRPVRQPTPAGA